MNQFDLSLLEFAYVLGKPEYGGDFRRECEDFKVFEQLPEPPSGEGEHVYLYVQKRNNNTAWVAKQIARAAGVQNMDVSYAGLKDRRALTQQWFSVYLPKGAEPDWLSLDIEGCQVLEVSRSSRKLRRGDHAHNRFEIWLRDCDGEQAEWEARLAQIGAGVPNYFGEQRFGIDGANLVAAVAWFEQGKRPRGRQLQQFVVSAARSFLFNRVVSARVQAGTWRSAIDGDIDGQPSGPMWGRGRLASGGQALAIEQAQVADFQPWCEQLEHRGLSQERRPLCLSPEAFSWRWQGRDLGLQLQLGPGNYATSVLREIALLRGHQESH